MKPLFVDMLICCSVLGIAKYIAPLPHHHEKNNKNKTVYKIFTLWYLSLNMQQIDSDGMVGGHRVYVISQRVLEEPWRVLEEA